MANIGATSVTVTGSFDSVQNNDVSQAPPSKRTIEVVGSNNVLESNTALGIALSQGSDNLITGNSVSAGSSGSGALVMIGSAFRNVIRDNTMTNGALSGNSNTDDFRFDYVIEACHFIPHLRPRQAADPRSQDNLVINNTADVLKFTGIFRNNTVQDNVVAAGPLQAEYLATGNTVVGNSASGSNGIMLKSGVLDNSIQRNAVDSIRIRHGVMSNIVEDNTALDPTWHSNHLYVVRGRRRAARLRTLTLRLKTGLRSCG